VKLALGTAQFGLAYGIAIQQPQISYTESKAIIDYASRRGMSVLDTAMGYGESESRLGNIGVQNWKVISKISEVPKGENTSIWINSAVRESIKKLKLQSLYGLLLHRPSQLKEQNGLEIYRALHDLKADGLVKKIGVSIYHPSELEAVFTVGEFDLVQSPLSVFDRRLITSGWLDKLADRGIEIHARSVFLQGLLLMTSGQRPRKFNQWSDIWTRYERWVFDTGLSPLEACIASVTGIPQIHQVIVGVNGLNHIKDILAFKTNTEPICLPNLGIDDEALLNPLYWLKV